MAKATKAAAAAAGATCYGCGAAAPADAEHPIVGVLNVNDVDDAYEHTIANPMTDKAPDGEQYIGVAVCAECHKSPEHRTLHPLKCHFFERGASRLGLMMAGSSNLGG